MNMTQSKQAKTTADFLLLPEEKEAVQQIFFDGISGMTVGAANCKLHFHQVLGIDEKTSKEQRKIVLTAVIPTAALVELCQTTLQSMAENSEALKFALTQQQERIITAFGSVPKISETGQPK